MHSQTSNSYKPFTGTFERVQLEFVPEPPLTEEERYNYKANYPTEMAFLNIYLDGENASEIVPSGYFLGLLIGLLDSFVRLATRHTVTATATWGPSDPWRLDLSSNCARGQIGIDLYVPDLWVPIRDACVPLIQFGRELVVMAQKWDKYITDLYQGEITKPGWEGHYLSYKDYLTKAEETLASLYLRSAED